MERRNLTTVAVLSDAVTICEFNGMKIVRVLHNEAEAGISLHGGHLIWYRPADEADVIWLSEKAEFDPAKAIRGGIPVCWPWFGKTATPSHGFARISEWSLLEHRENENGVIVALSLEDSDDTRAIWPHKFRNILTFEIGRSLKVSLTSTNTDDSPWNYAGALHSYFQIQDIRCTQITGMGTDFLDSTKGNEADSTAEPLTFEGEVDRVYVRPQATITIDDNAARQLLITNHGHNAAVIWNPWQALSEAMGDMADNSYETMVCVESTIHSDQTITLAPGESHTLSTEVRVSR